MAAIEVGQALIGKDDDIGADLLVGLDCNIYPPSALNMTKQNEISELLVRAIQGYTVV